jgi:hypothetical protein
MPLHWFIASCYLSIAALNIYRTGFGSLNWIPWILLAVGILSLEYTPVEQDGKKRPTIIFSGRNKASFAATILGVALLLGLAIYHSRR